MKFAGKISGGRTAFGLALLVLSLSALPARAQLFCPPTGNGNGGANGPFVLTSGVCTNGSDGGAFSTAALSSQAIGDIQQSASQQAAAAAMDAISARRKEETERCPEGFERVAGVCRRVETSPSSSSSAPASRRTPRPDNRPTPVPVKAPVVVVDPGWRIGAWAQGFGDYEQRTGSGNSSVCGTGQPCDTNNPAQNFPIVVDVKQTTTTVGGLGGVDWTKRNLFGQGDGLILGLLTAYTSSHINMSSVAQPTPLPPANSAGPGTGFGASKVQIAGPSVGGYFTYFNGGFSVDAALKGEFLSINESFTEVLSYSGNNGGNGPGTLNFLNSGVASTRVTNFVAASNIQYRIPIFGKLWFEPTAGFLYVNSSYDSSAALLGLESGYDWRVQGGGRFGISSFWNSVFVTTTVTGLAYSDVVIVGGPITGGAGGGAFAGTTVLPSDLGKVRGQGIFNTNFDFGNGFSTFIQAEVRGGSGLFGAGGRGGVRMQF